MEAVLPTTATLPPECDLLPVLATAILNAPCTASRLLGGT